jgi:hypothetical protein
MYTIEAIENNFPMVQVSDIVANYIRILEAKA